MESAIFLLTFALLILLGILFLAGLISVRRIAARDESLRKSLSTPIQMMAIVGLAIAFICSCVLLCPVLLNLSSMTTTREFEKMECNEIPITDTYKMVVAKRRDGKVEASIDGIDGEGGFIWVTEYAVANRYLTGVADGDYFWIDPSTRGQRAYDKREDYFASLKGLGITTVPEFSSADTICQTHQCRPCPIK